MKHGASAEMNARLRWHAGLADATDPGIPSVAVSTWPPGEPSAELERAVSDVIGTLERLKRELNGPVPSERVAGADVVPISVAYAVAEIVRDAPRARRVV